ncbi:MAG: metallophosphoesterase family protein [Gammaproteobacteria bacterium]|nr:metallophosphoesterase family protein [Gammaproteobacteria bacterium]
MDFRDDARVTVALVSDTHGRVDARVADAVADCEIAVHGGDIGHAGVLQALAPRRGHVAAVRGNNDSPRRWPAEDHRVLEGLAQVVRLALPGGDLVVVHGDRFEPARRRHERLRRRFPDAQAVLYGHTHRLVIDRDAAPWVLNPGAAGHERTFGGPSCLILHAGRDAWHLEARRFGLADKRAVAVR